jgi:hypothetical protein
MARTPDLSKTPTPGGGMRKPVGNSKNILHIKTKR